jgi:hypothetical protein
MTDFYKALLWTDCCALKLCPFAARYTHKLRRKDRQTSRMHKKAARRLAVRDMHDEALRR